MIVNFKRIGNHSLPLPNPETRESAAADLRAARSFTVPAGGFTKIPTGFAVEIPSGYVGLVCPRSGLAAKHGITVLNAPGVIDADFRGEVCVLVQNTSTIDFDIVKGDRIAQLMITSNTLFTTSEATELTETVRGSGGFGSTGVK